MATAVISGTINTPTAAGELAIIDGGKTIVVTITGDTLKPL